jgi:hypothetical protein
MQVKINVSAAAGGPKVTIKNGVAWADNEVTELFLSGEHYIA